MVQFMIVHRCELCNVTVKSAENLKKHMQDLHGILTVEETHDKG